MAADALSRRPDHEINSLSIISSDEKFQELIAQSYLSDKFFAELYKFLQNPIPVSEIMDKSILSTHTWYLLENNLLYYIRDSRFKRLCLPKSDAIFKKVFYEFHDSPASGHRGCTRLYLRMREFFFWPGMSKDILKYVRGCHSCQTNNNSNQHTAGILKPLDIPHLPFESVSMDFIINLPKTKSGNTGIYVMVDRHSKLLSFHPMPPNFDAPFTAKIYFDVVVRRFGLPKSIISDRDSRFMSLFWNKLFQFFGTKLKPSSSFHPQTDGQTEVMNKTLETMLRHYVSFKLDDWDEWLPILEFAYNSTPQKSTGFTPFYLVLGYHPRDPFCLSFVGSSGNQSVDSWLTELQEARSIAQDAIMIAQTNQAKYANQFRNLIEFKEGDSVLLSTKNLHVFTKSDAGKKFKPRFIGPFKILEKLSSLNYKLELPSHLSKLHPVFHVSLLKQYQVPNEKIQSSYERPPPVFIDEEAQQFYEVEKILGHRTYRAKKQYLVQWKGYPLHDSTWEPAHVIKQDVPDLVRDYEASN